MKIFLIVPFLLLVTSCTLISKDVSQNPDPKMTDSVSHKGEMKMDQKTQWTKEEMEDMKDDHMMTGGTMMKDDHMTGATMENRYLPYSSELASSAMKSGKTVVLFFAATWCPSCQSLNKTIETGMSTIPSDTLIFNVDYDNSSELKKKYGVVTQHTTVILNSDGSMKSKKIGAQRVEEVIGN